MPVSNSSNNGHVLGVISQHRQLLRLGNISNKEMTEYAPLLAWWWQKAEAL